MNLVKAAATQADNFVAKVNNLVPFGKFERFTAGFCIAIPIFLLISGMPKEARSLTLLVYPIAITLVLPFLIPVFSRIFNKKYHGTWLTILGALAFFGFYLLFTRYYELKSKPSISAYVTMEDSFVFGMVLAIGAMHFIANGVVYWNDKTIEDLWWRRYLNVVLGILLLGVIIFPCTTMKVPHFICAGLFFLGCGVGTAFRTKSKKGAKAVVHWIMDLAPLIVMLWALMAHFGPEMGWWQARENKLIDLFGAESIALTITGLDFILCSLKREPEDQKT